MLSEILLWVATAAVGLYYLQRHVYSYWERHNVKFLRPRFFVGNFSDLFMMRRCIDCLIAHLYSDPSLKPDDAFVGVYNCFRPAIVLRDLELIKRILIKDFNDFPNRVWRPDPHHDPLGSNNLLVVRNPKWRELRSKLSPVFSSGKTKQMYPLMTEVALDLETLLQSFDNGTNVDIKNIASRFTNELIGTTAFGIRAGNFSNPNTSFYRHSLAVFEATPARALVILVNLLLPAVASVLRTKVFSEETSQFLRESIADIIAERERTGDKRNDLIDVLIAMKQEAQADEANFNPAQVHDFLVAQAAIFLTAGFETSSATMSFTLYELALQPELQTRLRDEIRDAFAEAEQNGQKEISYERLQELPYLNQVVEEALRKYPIGASTQRECTPSGGKNGYSMTPFSDFVIPAGMAVFVSNLGIHRDERYWPEPDKFDPDRFAPENRKNLNMNAYLPFGLGPRNCIGSRIGLLQTKLGLAHLLKDHRVLPCTQTPKEIEFDTRTVALASKTPIYLKLHRT